MIFKSREHAAEILSDALRSELPLQDATVVAIPRGGVVVGRRIADRLSLPLHLLLTKKIGAPGNPELAVGAMTEGGIVYLEKKLIDDLGVSSSYLEKEKDRLLMKLQERRNAYRLPPFDPAGKTCILVDDGAATGSTIFAALAELKKRRAKKSIVALPVAPPETVEKLRKEADTVYVLTTPSHFQAVGQFFEQWAEVTDQEVVQLISK
ncbi:MAG TPA: phosphoribosyltransferase family protein [Patescibacteria group bacterium]|nr:phosphoribosyltransferase family protein [Patescibacteria group bacterium]